MLHFEISLVCMMDRCKTHPAVFQMWLTALIACFLPVAGGGTFESARMSWSHSRHVGCWYHHGVIAGTSRQEEYEYCALMLYRRKTVTQRVHIWNLARLESRGVSVGMSSSAGQSIWCPIARAQTRSRWIDQSKIVKVVFDVWVTQMSGTNLCSATAHATLVYFGVQMHAWSRVAM